MNKMLMGIVALLCVCLGTSGFALKQTFQTMAITKRNAELELQLENIQFGNDTELRDLRDRVAELERRLDSEIIVAGWCFERFDPEWKACERMMELGIYQDWGDFSIRNCGDWDTQITEFLFGTEGNLLEIEIADPGCLPKIFGYDEIRFLFNYNWTEGTRYYLKVTTDSGFVLEWNGIATSWREFP
jgi:hypothetical protein